ncbi:unnamed protein product [Nesidiocoris tenuis]|uniref:ubiquitinyl hydrolase 1 n=1 Tax=Nesidiocoris tenuis TaxID=355587 RepID=A0A6H5HAB8_9HEMI|nr:unnamed protein product [Nesidiocoris tenuis]
MPSLEAAVKSRSKMYQSRSLKEVKDAIVAEELRKVLINLTDQGAKGAISPESLFLVIWKVVPRYRGYAQQDAHEFLRYMLDRLHTELLHLLPDFSLKDSHFISHKNKTSIVTSVFGGTLQSEVLCLHLKRFRWTNFFRTKVDAYVTFPVIALDMSQFVLSDLPDTRRSSTQLYDLAAVIVHHGSGSGCGHYTAFAINGERHMNSP